MIQNMIVVVPTLIMASVTLVLSLCLINTGIHDSEHFRVLGFIIYEHLRG